MKLSEIQGDRVLDVIADLIEPVTSIATDDEAAKLFKRESCPEDMDPGEFMLGRIREAAPKLMKGHKEDLIAILATLDGKPVEEYRNGMTMASVIGGFVELLTDEEFLAFFS